MGVRNGWHELEHRQAMRSNNPSEIRAFEASWRYRMGPVESQATARAILESVGDILSMEPAAYELNGRGQWRPFELQHLLIDMVTQRTQLVRLAEERGSEDGGASVLIATGKHGEPPQAFATWREEWPLSRERRERWQEALERRSGPIPLSLFVLRVNPIEAVAEPGPLQLVLAERELRRDLKRSLGPAHWEGSAGAGMWSFFDEGEPPVELGL